jgi:hypothetical protein
VYARHTRPAQVNVVDCNGTTPLWEAIKQVRSVVVETPLWVVGGVDYSMLTVWSLGDEYAALSFIIAALPTSLRRCTRTATVHCPLAPTEHTDACSRRRRRQT